MVEASCCVLLLGPLSHTTHSGLGAADGSPGELRGGKRIAEHGAVGLCRLRCVRRDLSVATSNLNLSGASSAGGQPRHTIVTQKLKSWRVIMFLLVVVWVPLITTRKLTQD